MVEIRSLCLDFVDLEPKQFFCNLMRSTLHDSPTFNVFPASALPLATQGKDLPELHVQVCFGPHAIQTML